MKRALLAHNEGGRIAQVVEPGAEFPVQWPLEWIDAPDEITTAWTATAEGVPVAPDPPAVEPPSLSFEDRVLAALQALEAGGKVTPGTTR